MLRSFLPFILASLGFTLVAVATSLPLFEWQISEIVADFPPEVQINPSPWKTRLGESLDDDRYIGFYQIYLVKGNQTYRVEDLSSIVRRSQNDEALEQVALDFNQNIMPWVADVARINLLFLLCLVFIWLATFLHKRPIYEAVIFTVIAVAFSCNMLNVWKGFLYKVVPAFVESGVFGTVTLSASLSKIHYETMIVLFMGICAELGSVGIMLLEVIRAVAQKEEPSISAVG